MSHSPTNFINNTIEDRKQAMPSEIRICLSLDPTTLASLKPVVREFVESLFRLEGGAQPSSQPEALPDLWKIEQSAKYAQVSPAKVRSWIKQGLLPSYGA